ncbi:diguanylate cyclase [Thiorhodococcus mannitoliphagus]|uniref:diguanylate cyclase n=1 Tax=Thiorhodococcus mannitoliphagus TaxID=329406 RepID=A0A6P1DWS1_9GAMM|nr:GGDEF domain-containing protein [Thiorhodococcus mannitoliphagus]NEX21900.1 diguanylate cyclase [Thiorhodococcus mannitoliphagus]
MNEADRRYLAAATQQIEALLAARAAKPLQPTGLSEGLQPFAERLDALLESLAALRRLSIALANGDLAHETPSGSHLLGPLKQLQSSLRHLTWQTQQVAQGDLEQHVDFLGDFSDAFNQMIQALREKRLAEEKIRYLSEHDSLTGLHNRAFFDTELARLRAKGTYPVSLIIADLDGLKRVNDELGHHVGDLLIQKAAQVLQTSLGPDDVLARLGGDEFAIILPGAGASQADTVLARLRTAEANANRKEAVFPIHISLGAGVASDPTDLREALRRADEAMYADKAERKAASGDRSQRR